MPKTDYIIDYEDAILITGSSGFIGTRVVETLLSYGFSNLKCFVRPSSNTEKLEGIIKRSGKKKVRIMKGNLLSRDDCNEACKDIKVVFHLAAGVEKSFAGCFLNSVVTTRNLLDAIISEVDFKRFLNVSSIAVYTGINQKRGSLLDEESDIEKHSYNRFEAYTYGKIKQDEIVFAYNREHRIPYVIVRPGVVYGPGKKQILGRVGIDTFGVFMNIGESNSFPLTYVENCAEAIVLAGLRKGIDGEVFNIVDDNLPTCSEFLDLYKKKARRFFSVKVPYKAFYFFCYLWEKYSQWSNGQLPPAFNRMRCEAHWKGRTFTNQKAKKLLEWNIKVPFDEAAGNFFEYVRSGD